ncbi:MAG: hypothetical protein A2Z34_02775 [Planctomycetes bacterium RBG_16_59_8]|nr:MAG: hypothetical protein A2Z34_02775 [Planctomycetes bacterium RBG_16_59_8]
MMRTLTLLGLAISLIPGMLTTGAAAEEKEKPRIEVVFCLDTTGSMSGLIDSAKQKIWSIVNEIARAEPSPELSVGLVPYRDRGDSYVTKVFHLTNDLDKVYGDLSTFAADGGGDGPEHVNKALQDAVHEIRWSKSGGKSPVLQIVFLVGDCPPHMDYNDGLDYRKIAPEAIARGIMINTIRCGSDAQTETHWREIAKLSDGAYTSIAQSGGTVAIATPVDGKLAELSKKINETYVPYGERGRAGEAAQFSADSKAKEAAPAAAAERALAKSGAMYKNDSWDLVDALVENRRKIEELKPEELPAEMQKMTPEERVAHIEKKRKEREEIQKEIAELSKQRDEHVKAEMKKLSLGGEKSFDEEVRKTIREQAEKKGYSFK